MTVADLIIKLGLNSSGVSRGADAAIKEFNRIAKSAASFAAGFVGIGAISAGVEELGRKTVEYAGKINDLSTETGASTDALQEFDYAAEQTGAKLEDISSALTKVAKNQAEALKGDTGKRNAFERLGASLKDLKSQSPEEIFRKIADQVKELPPSAQLTADVMDTLGKSATNLIPAFRAGFSEAAAQARALGVVIDKEVITKLDSLGDDWTTIGFQMRAGLAPVLGWLTDQLREAQARAFGFLAALLSIGTNLRNNPKQFLTNPRGIIAEAAAEGIGSYVQFKKEQSDATAANARRNRGPAPDPDAETTAKKVADLRKKNADALEELYQKQLSREERITFLHQRRAEIAKQLANTTDGLKREELVAQDIDAIKGLQSLKKTSKSALSSPPQADDLARRGLFLGGIPQMNTLAQRQIQELRTVNRNLTQIDRSLNAE
jgi:hypothetical protein